MTDWFRVTYLECEHCGHRTYRDLEFVSRFFNPNHCPKCGEYGYEIVTYLKRVVRSGTWWKPWTIRKRVEEKNIESTVPNSPNYSPDLERKKKW